MMMTSDEFRYELKVPKDRVGVLVGIKGKIKRKIEGETNTHLEVDSKEGEVVISGNDGLDIYVAKNIVLAIARGFNPELAMQLIKPDMNLEIISLKDIARNKNDLARLKGRIIGEGGKTRNIIEDMTESYVVVYGKTIGFIGQIEAVTTARKAVEMLIGGSPHRNVYKWLERQKRLQTSRTAMGM